MIVILYLKIIGIKKNQSKLLKTNCHFCEQNSLNNLVVFNGNFMHFNLAFYKFI